MTKPHPPTFGTDQISTQGTRLERVPDSAGEDVKNLFQLDDFSAD